MNENVNTAPINSTLSNSANVLNDLNAFVIGSNVNVLYKAFVLGAILIVFAAIPQTSRFAVWAAWIIVLLLLLQGK